VSLACLIRLEIYSQAKGSPFSKQTINLITVPSYQHCGSYDEQGRSFFTIPLIWNQLSQSLSQPLGAVNAFLLVFSDSSTGFQEIVTSTDDLTWFYEQIWLAHKNSIFHIISRWQLYRIFVYLCVQKDVSQTLLTFICAGSLWFNEFVDKCWNESGIQNPRIKVRVRTYDQCVQWKP